MMMKDAYGPNGRRAATGTPCWAGLGLLAPFGAMLFWAMLFGAMLSAALWSDAASAEEKAASPTTELVMIDASYCWVCEQWKEDIGVFYHKTDEGKRAPLRIIEIHTDEMRALGLYPPPDITPTFVLMQDGKEVGRIDGYASEDFFWQFLAQLMRKVPAAPA